MRALLANSISTPAQDAIGVFDQDFNQVFPRARPTKVLVQERAKLMEHPIESGATTADHRVILQTQIELSLLLQARDYLDTYREIKQYWNNGTLLVVQTNSGVYPDQLISALPHREEPDFYGALTMTLILQQFQTVTAKFTVTPRRPANRSTVARGEIQPQPAGPTTAQGIRDRLGNFFYGKKT